MSQDEPSFGKKSDIRVVRKIPRVRDQVIESLRDAIVNMHFAPGQRLSEGELCESMGTSRASLRQALRVLESEGLIDTQKGRGVIVATLDGPTAKELYTVRAGLEGLLAKLYVEAATDEDLKDLESMIEGMESSMERGRANADLIRQVDLLYDAMFERTNNPTLEKFLRIVHGRLPWLRASTTNHPARGEASIAELREFAEAAWSRDPEEARQAMERHVVNAGKVAQKLLEESPTLTS